MARYARVRAVRSPLTAEDLVAFAFLTDAQVSPDGERVAYAVRTIDAKKDAYRSALQVVPFDGSSRPRRLAGGVGRDGAPRWSPDGSWIAFLSDRGAPRRRAGEGERAKRPPKNVFLVRADGGAPPRQLTRSADDCADLAWSPRGDALVFVAKDPADAEGPRDGIKVYDRVRYKADDGGLFDLRRKHLWLARIGPAGELADDAPRQLTRGDWDDLQPAFSPDGARIAFVSNRTAERDRNTVSDIWVCDADGGEPRRVTDERGSHTDPSWSPDGSLVTCYGVAEAIGSQARNVRLWVFPIGGCAGRDLLGEWDRTVGSVVISDMRSHVPTLPPAWSADAARVFFVGSDRGTANLHSVAADGGDVRAHTEGAHQVVSA
ncbi:MAG: TolB family protein, partial [Candidatus Limnocylindria bacterium]